MPPLNALLRTPPLLDLALVPGVTVETIADPFPVSHDGRLVVFAEVLGRRAGGSPFKKIGVFSVADDLGRAEWLGEACPDDDGLCSFPFVLRDADRFVLVPEVFVPMQGSGPAILQVLQVWITDAREFPFGWRKHHEGRLPGCAAPSDKVLMKTADGAWRLFCSDNAMQRLLAFASDDLRRWEPVSAQPVVSRDTALPPGLSPGPHPWRLGGGPLLANGLTALPLQHGRGGISYGGAVTLLSLLDGTRPGGRTELESAPVLAADPDREWMSRGAHHVALVRHGGRTLLATDGSDGRAWRSTVVALDGRTDLEPLP